MTSLQFTDHRTDPGGWATTLGCSVAACELLLDSHFIDLHCDMEVPVRVMRYNPGVTHRKPKRTRPLMGQTDYGRLREASMTGVAYDIATNPIRSKRNRLKTVQSNVAAAVARVETYDGEQAVVRSASEYDAVVASGRTAYFITLQGGNAISADPSVLEGDFGQQLHRITLVHLTSSDLGGTSSPAGKDEGITALGRDVVKACNAQRIVVDLAHAGRTTFWDALEEHDPDLPPIVSHTGVEGVHPHWRNLDDPQIRAIGDRGGVVGIMYQSSFLAPVKWTCARSAILDHLGHVMNTAGDHVAAIGTDYDGWIIPPHDLLDVTHHPLLVQDMLDRGWSETQIRGILGENYLRVVRDLRA